MVGRIWHGWTTPANAPIYERFLLSEVLPSIEVKHLPGYDGAHVLRRNLGEEIEFLTILWFDSPEGVRALAGEDYEVAFVLPKAREVLTRFDARSQHYETLLVPGANAV